MKFRDVLMLAAMVALPAGACVQDVGPSALFPMVVTFERDSIVWRWTEAEQKQVQDICHFLQEHPDEQVVIGGHTGKPGGEEYNLALSLRLADEVRRKLMLAGCPVGQLSSQGYGEEKQPDAKSGLSPWRAEIQWQGHEGSLTP